MCAETSEMSACTTKNRRILHAPKEVSVNGITHVRADASMQVLCPQDYSLGSFTRPVGGGKNIRERIGRLMIELPRCVQHRRTNHLVEDVTIGSTL